VFTNCTKKPTVIIEIHFIMDIWTSIIFRFW